MEQITAMKITGLTLTNFRNHTEPTHFDFGDITYITGHNGTGKTTTAHAVCYALYGVSYYGEQKIERLMNEKADSVKVQMDFIDQNGVAHSLVRTRFNEKNSLLYDGYTITQTHLEQMFCDTLPFVNFTLLNSFSLIVVRETVSILEGMNVIVPLSVAVNLIVYFLSGGDITNLESPSV